MKTHETFWRVMGGRKMFNGYLAYATLTAMALYLKPTFGEFALGILGALGITGGLVAFEDKQSKGGSGSFLQRRAGDPTEEEGS